MRRPEDTFLALNGDILTTLDFALLARRNRERGAIATMAIKERYVDIEYGVVHRDSEGRIDRLEEKPRLQFTVSMGIYAMEPQIIDLIAPGRAHRLPRLAVAGQGRRPRGADLPA